MSNVTINGKPVTHKATAAFLSNLTKTQGLGDTVISCAEFIGAITVNEEFEGESVEGLAKLANMTRGKMDAVVEIMDEGKTPRPRVTTWASVLSLATAAVKAYPAAKKIDSIGNDLPRGLVTFLDSKTQETSSNVKELDFEADYS